MIEKKEVEALAALARLELSESESEKIHRDLEGVLAYVSELKNASSAKEVTDGGLVRNVMRADTDPNARGAYREKLLAEVPHSKNGFVEVKKILGESSA